jgi:hypothetical protein
MHKLQVLNASNNIFAMVDNSKLCGIDDNSIKNLNLVELYAYNNSMITNINHMNNLRVLDASGNCGIDDKNIKDLNLIKLYASRNIKITSIDHMSNLQQRVIIAALAI